MAMPTSIYLYVFLKCDTNTLDASATILRQNKSDEKMKFVEAIIQRIKESICLSEK